MQKSPIKKSIFCHREPLCVGAKNSGTLSRGTVPITKADVLDPTHLPRHWDSQVTRVSGVYVLSQYMYKHIHTTHTCINKSKCVGSKNCPTLPCNTLQHSRTPFNTLQHPATPCNTGTVHITKWHRTHNKSKCVGSNKCVATHLPRHWDSQFTRVSGVHVLG